MNCRPKLAKVFMPFKKESPHATNTSSIRTTLVKIRSALTYAGNYLPSTWMCRKPKGSTSSRQISEYAELASVITNTTLSQRCDGVEELW